MEKENKSNYSTPIAIILAGIIIAGAMYFRDDKKNNDLPPVALSEQKIVNIDNLLPISEQDHLRGNPNADIIIVEYSDTECPFCGRLHVTLNQIMAEYGKDGKVAWVYRHFPLDQLHAKARIEAVALECASELGGNDKFWEYTDILYVITPANDGLDLAELPKIATQIGLNETAFNECLLSGRYDNLIESHVQNAKATGGTGTPWSVVITKSGQKYPLNGAQPYATIKQMIDSLLKP